MMATAATADRIEIQWIQTGTDIYSFGRPVQRDIAIANQMAGFHAVISPEIIIPTIIAESEWLGVIEERIKSSVAVAGYIPDREAAWLEPDVARAAVSFFRTYSTVLPGEPHIYPSLAGDLIAEFAGLQGKLTCVISPKFVILFAAVDEGIVEKTFIADQQNANEIRKQIEAVTKMLSATPNGKMESRR